MKIITVLLLIQISTYLHPLSCNFMQPHKSSKSVTNGVRIVNKNVTPYRFDQHCCINGYLEKCCSYNYDELASHPGGVRTKTQDCFIKLSFIPPPPPPFFQYLSPYKVFLKSQGLFRFFKLKWKKKWPKGMGWKILREYRDL